MTALTGRQRQVLRPRLYMNQVQDKARHIRRTIGTRPAAGYLRNRGVSLEAALFILLNK